MTRTRTFHGCQLYETQGDDVSEGFPSAHEPSILQDPGDNVHENVQISDGQGNFRVKRGVTYARDVWSLSLGCKVIVDCNELAQPVDKAAGILSSWLGTVARNGRMCPLDFDDWRKLKKLYGNYLIGQVKLKFTFPRNMYVDGWILESLDQKWRNFKHALKEKFIPQVVLEDTPARELRKIEIITHVPPRVVAAQWKNLVEYWFSEKSMKRSIAGKCAKKTSLERGINLHTTGSKSYARRKKEFVDENGRAPGKIEFFQITHLKKRKNNEGTLTFINEISQQKVEEAKRILQERSLESELSSDNIETEVFDEVFGRQKSGLPRGYGIGAKNSGFKEGYALGRNLSENEEFDAMKLQMKDMLEKIKDLETENRTFKTMLSQNRAEPSLVHDPLAKAPTTFSKQNLKLPHQGVKNFVQYSGGSSSNTFHVNNEDGGFLNLLQSSGSHAHQANSMDLYRSFLQFMEDNQLALD